VRKADNLPPSCAVVTKSGNVNLLEPSWPVQACNGTVLPFTNYNIVVFMTVSIYRYIHTTVLYYKQFHIYLLSQRRGVFFLPGGTGESFKRFIPAYRTTGGAEIHGGFFEVK